MFYTFEQNNSGGVYDEDPERGIGEYVIMEARNADEANGRMEELVWWNMAGGQSGYCKCCGVRWRYAYGDGDKRPTISNLPAGVYADTYPYGNPGNIFVHYLNGTVERVAS